MQDPHPKLHFRLHVCYTEHSLLRSHLLWGRHVSPGDVSFAHVSEVCAFYEFSAMKLRSGGSGDRVKLSLSMRCHNLGNEVSKSRWLVS